MTAPIYSDDFLAFWARYPRRTAKRDAWKAWQQEAPPLADVLAALDWQIPQPQWQKEDGQFIPYPASWLRAGRWEDQPFTPLAPSDAFARVAAKMGRTQ